MKKILERNFIAVNLKGEHLRIENLPELIVSYGLYYFYKDFGFTHGKITYLPNYNIQSPYSEFKRYFCDSKKPKSEFEYVITDGFGRQYSPEYLVEQLFKEYPEKAEKLWKSSIRKNHLNGYKSSKLWMPRLRRKYRLPSNKKLFIQDEFLKKEGVKGIRDIKSYYDCPYEPEYQKGNQKNWKQYRKTQYK